MLLHQLIEGLQGIDVCGSTEVEISDVCYDSRKVTPGALFVAVPSVGGGPESGGWEHVSTAIARGALAVLAEKSFDDNTAASLRVDNAREALADLAVNFYGRPSEALQVFAVTGTDGKTTSTYLLDQIFTAAGFRTGLMGTIEVKIGDARVHNSERMTTPESLDLQRLLADMRKAGVSHVAMEASSHAISLQRLRGTSFAACGLTNITRDHVEFHGSWDKYFEAKASLFSDIAEGKPAVLNRDDHHFDRLASRVRGTILAYGFHPDADLHARDLRPTPQGCAFSLQTSGASQTVSLQFPGRFNVLNALTAAGLALVAGVELEVVAQALNAAKPPPGRMQEVSAGQPFKVVIDYAHTVNAFESALAVLRETVPPGGRLAAVFGAAGNRDRAKRPALAGIARTYTDFFFVTNEDPCDEPAARIIDEIVAGVPVDEEGQRYLRVADRREAIQAALEWARPGDVVAILGKGHEQSIVTRGHKEPWSDLGAVREALGVPA